MRITLSALVLAGLVAFAPVRADDFPPLFEQRVAAQRAIETVYWNHRIWPEHNPGPKPGLAAIVSDEALRLKVEDYLKKSRALETLWKRPLTPSRLQAELQRMADSTRRPEVLEELFAALDHDPTLVAECLVRPLLADRQIREAYATDRPRRDEGPFDAWWAKTAPQIEMLADAPQARYTLPSAANVCTDDTWSPIPAVAPDGRRSHTAVWTGSELIVWGGQDTSSYVGTGGRYDPATDTWGEMGLPPLGGRAGHSAVWTGTEMIVWGGFNGTFLGTGLRYAPATDTWTQTSNFTSGRSAHSAVWTGSEMIVWGGTTGSPIGNLNNGARYDPSGDSWSNVTTVGAPQGRASHTAIWTGSEMIVWGGDTPVFMGSPLYFNSGGRYDPVGDSWTTTSTGANVPQGRTEHSGVWSGSELIVWGGRFGPSTYPTTGGRYDPVANTWTPTSTGANVPAGRRNAVEAWTGSAMVVWGGDSFSGGTIYHDTGGLYDPVGDSWTATDTGAGNPSARTQHAGVWTGSELVVWGGLAAGVHENTGGRLTPGTNSWVTTGLGTTVPGNRRGHTGVWTGAEMIVWGGTGTGVGSTGGRYDPATNVWQATSVGANVPSSRSRHAGVWTGTHLVVWGGGDPAVDTGGRYEPVTDSWQTTSTGANLPSARQDHTAVWTGKEMIVWGGSDGAPANTGGRYDPVADTWSATGTGANVPSGRNGHTAVWTGKEMIVWGGVDTGFVDTGARYYAKTDTWTPTSTGANVPQARRTHTGIWTGSHMVVWGGSFFSGGTLYLGTGGRYDPALDTWTPTSMTSAPSARDSHTAVWTRETMIVWGGWNGGIPFKAGGRYDPILDTWTATSTGTGTPSGRIGHSAVWADGEMMVWSGFANAVFKSGGARYCACSVRSPGAVPSLNVTKPTSGSTTARLTWLSVTGATGYDVVTGKISTLESSAGDFAASTESCLTQNRSTTTLDDVATPASGDGAWYLLRAANCGGVGGYDSGGAEQSGTRDAEIAASGNGCP